ncbi:MAG: PmoA family protein, partial [Planctomycetes bacterium]|nr:PmoA family protein [Planctomycetota bacterium]
TTSEGKDRIDGNHTRPEWVSLSGKIDGQPAALTVMGHPTNYGFPQPVRLHPTKPYFCFAPMVLGEFKLEKSRPYVSRYRFLVHDGALDQVLNRSVWSDYAEPPSVRSVKGEE